MHPLNQLTRRLIITALGIFLKESGNYNYTNGSEIICKSTSVDTLFRQFMSNPTDCKVKFVFKVVIVISYSLSFTTSVKVEFIKIIATR